MNNFEFAVSVLWPEGLPDEALPIYAQEYWLGSCCDILPRRLGIMVLDTAVMYRSTVVAIKLLQRALGCEPDGEWGEQTTLYLIARTNTRADEDFALRQFTAARQTLEAQLVIQQPLDEQSSHGWMNQINNLLTTLMPMADDPAQFHFG